VFHQPSFVSLRRFAGPALIFILALGVVQLGGCPPMEPPGDDGGAVDGGDGGGSDGGGTDGGTDGGGSDGGGSDGGRDRRRRDGWRRHGRRWHRRRRAGDGGDQTPSEPDPDPPTGFNLLGIAMSGDPVPDQPDGVTFGRFGNPVIDNTGRVAFWATFTNNGPTGGGGLYVWDADNGLRKVVDDNPASAGIVPGRETADYFGTFTGTADRQTDLVWGGGDRLLFIADVTGQKVSRGIYRWRATDGDIVRVVDLEQVEGLFTDAFPGGFDPTYVLPGVTDSGIAYFGLSYLYLQSGDDGAFVSGRGVFKSTGTSVSAVADSQFSPDSPGNVPDQDSDTFYNLPDTLTTVNGTDALFQSLYSGGDGMIGLYFITGGSVFRVIDNRTGASWPGLATGTRVNPNSNLFTTFAVGPNRHIVIDTTLTVSGSGRETVLHWDFGTQRWTELTGNNNSPATNLLSGVNDDGQALVIAAGSPYIASPGARQRLNSVLPATIAGSAIAWRANIGSINNSGRGVLGYTREGNQEGLLFWNGTELLVVADVASDLPAGYDDIELITDPRRDRPQRSGLLNHRDEIVFRATAPDDSEAIFIAQPQR
jgi:hypothetical protein